MKTNEEGVEDESKTNYKVKDSTYFHRIGYTEGVEDERKRGERFNHWIPTSKYVYSYTFKCFIHEEDYERFSYKQVFDKFLEEESHK